MRIANVERGYHIEVEGTDGTGKSTIANLIAERLRESLGRTVLRVDEPDSIYDEHGNALSPISAKIREVIKNGDLARRAFTNVLLFSASRGENWHQKSKLALSNGIDVVQARTDNSTKIYQGFAEGVDIDTINLLTRMATDETYMRRDVSVILDLDDSVERQRRIASRGALETPDTFEMRSADFQQKLIDGYRWLAQQEDIPIVSADGSIDEVLERVWAHVENHLKL